MSGWYSAQRDMFEHVIFKKNPERFYAWHWLIANAAYKNTKHIVKGKIHAVERGSIFVTLRSLATVWGWNSDTKVRNFLDLLQSDGMITRKTNAGKTQISICNYSLYQNVERTENAQETQTERTKVTNKQTTTLLAQVRENEFLEALGITDETKSVGLLNLSEPLRWLEAGCHVDLDILPTLRQIAARGKIVNSWAYCTKAVFEAKAKRLAPPPEIHTPNFRPQTSNSKPSVAALAMRSVTNE